MTRTIINTIFLLITLPLATFGQVIKKEIQADPNFSAGAYMAYPVSKITPDTPAPTGKKPFYISHYACPGAYYPDNHDCYDAPYATLSKADSLGMLTPLGRDVLQRVIQLRDDAYLRLGELSEIGAQQQRDIIHRMVLRFPEVFTQQADIRARSTTVNRCILAMEEATLEFAYLCKYSNIGHEATMMHHSYMSPQDWRIADSHMDSITTALFDDFIKHYSTNDKKLMRRLFNNKDYVRQHVNAQDLAHQLFILAGTIQNTQLFGKITLYDLFSDKDIYNHWKRENAWSYISYGAYTVNGGKQPYAVRLALRHIIEQADSVSRLNSPVVHPRYSSVNVILPLCCLMELDDCGVATNDLGNLDRHGWADYLMAPMGGNIQLVFYRTDPTDKDILVKVLLHERECRLPIATDCAPYYHWRELRDYYLRKLDAYEKN
ncbi:MAG: histidine-type phosphatase [Prevotella sp.]|nr:histidine-type phosphatase [Prevotella sp.]